MNAGAVSCNPVTFVAPGSFWIPEKSDFRVRSEFIADPGKRPEVALADTVVDDPRVLAVRRATQTIISVSAEPVRSVASFLPLTLHRQFDDGEPVTLLDAQNLGRVGGRASVSAGSRTARPATSNTLLMRMPVTRAASARPALSRRANWRA